MDIINNINWKAFKDMLLANPDLELQFQYTQDKWVDASYHITEIKQAPITSVDCGGVVNNWTEVIIQLWVPEGDRQLHAMKVSKALAIVAIVERALPLSPDAIVKIEFGNATFDTRQLIPGHIMVDGDNLLVDLRPDAVQCKAIGRGGSCGTTAEGDACCAPVAEKPKIKLVNLTVAAEACCTPGGGCC